MFEWATFREILLPYLDYANCKCKKRLIDKLVEKYDENADGNEIIYNVTLHVYGRICKSCALNMKLLIIMFLIIMGIRSAYFYFYWYTIKNCINALSFINLIATYVKMLYYDKNDVSDGNDVNKSNKPKEWMICHYWYFLDWNGKYEPEACDGCHDISTAAYELEKITILNIKGVDYRYVIRGMSRKDAISRLNNSELDGRGSLWILALVQTKHLSK